MLWEQQSAWQQDADSIISYMQRAYLAEVYDKTLHFKATDATLTRGLPDLSASLRQLVPNSGLPEKIPVTLQELQARICIRSQEIVTRSKD